MRENQKKRKNCKMSISGGHCFLSFPFFNLHKKKWLWTLAVLVLFCFVLVTFATKICSSFSAKRRPIHMRRPYPNGKLTNGWIRCPACGQFDTSPMKYFIRLNWNCAVHFFLFHCPCTYQVRHVWSIVLAKIGAVLGNIPPNLIRLNVEKWHVSMLFDDREKRT